jgi:hypothetical protein
MVEEIQRKFNGLPPQAALMAISDALGLFAAETRMLKKIVALAAEADGITYTLPSDFLDLAGVFYEVGGTDPGGSFPEVTKGPTPMSRLGGRAESTTASTTPCWQMHDEVLRIGYPSSAGFTALVDTIVTIEYYHFETGIAITSTTKIPEFYRPGIIAAASESFYEEREEYQKAARAFNRGEFYRKMGKRKAMSRGHRDPIQPVIQEF